MGDKRNNNLLARIANKVRTFLIGESRQLKLLSFEEKVVFYKELGINSIALVIMMIIFAFMANATFMRGELTTTIWQTIAIVVGMLFLKGTCPHYSLTEDIIKKVVECEYIRGLNILTIRYKGDLYPCDEYAFEDGVLTECLLIIKEEIHSDYKEEVCLYYDNESSKFIEQTTVTTISGLSFLYRFISWAMLATNLGVFVFWVCKFISVI